MRQLPALSVGDVFTAIIDEEDKVDKRRESKVSPGGREGPMRCQKELTMNKKSSSRRRGQARKETFLSAEHYSTARSLCVFSVTVVLGLGGAGRAEAQQPPSPRDPPELEWQQTFGGREGDRGHSVEQTSDGGYVLCGSTRSFGAGGSDV